MAAPAPELKTLGRYNIERTIGKGAMGVVYEGVDPRLGRRVAIKTILKSHLDEDTAKDYSMRFVREAQAVARSTTPTSCRSTTSARKANIAYLVMEFIKARSSRPSSTRTSAFDLKEAVRIMCELCDALDFAHNAGIIHRDIKPANVMLDAQARTKLTTSASRACRTRTRPRSSARRPARWSARRLTCRPSRSPAATSTSAPTFSPPASSSTSSLPARSVHRLGRLDHCEEDHPGGAAAALVAEQRRHAALRRGVNRALARTRTSASSRRATCR